MEIQTQLHRQSLVVRMQGELDHHSAARVRQVVDVTLAQRMVRNLVFNLQGLSFMDSSGIGVILGRYRLVREKGGRMAICRVPEAIRRVLQISGVPKVIPVEESEEQALALLGRPEEAE